MFCFSNSPSIYHLPWMEGYENGSNSIIQRKSFIGWALWNTYLSFSSRIYGIGVFILTSSWSLRLWGCEEWIFKKLIWEFWCTLKFENCFYRDLEDLSSEIWGLPWSSGEEFALLCRGHRFDPWPQKTHVPQSSYVCRPWLQTPALQLLTPACSRACAWQQD